MRRLRRYFGWRRAGVCRKVAWGYAKNHPHEPHPIISGPRVPHADDPDVSGWPR